MKVKSRLVMACLVVALVFSFASTTKAQAQCCFGEIIGAPIYAAGAVLVGAVTVVGGAASLVANAVAAPFNQCCTAYSPCAVPGPAAVCPGDCRG